MADFDVSVSRAQLFEYAQTVYGHTSLEPISRESFLHVVWSTLSSFVHFNKHNPLMQDANKRCPFFGVQSYTILTILYGTYSHEPTKIEILKDFIRLLEKDLIEEELKVIEYANTKAGRTYLGGLSQLLSKIRTIFSEPEFASEQLPPVPYHAYALLTLNHAYVIGPDVTFREIYEVISVDNDRMQNLFSLTDPPQK